MSEEILNDKVDEKNLITDETILNLKPLTFVTITGNDIVEFIHLQCQKVLSLAKEKNESREIAQAVNLDTFEVLSPVFGDSKSVNIDHLVSQMRGTEYAFVVMHNHPSGSHFSRKDIKTFVDAENMTILIVIGNNGDIYILEKTRQLSINELLSVRKSLIDWKNNNINFQDVIEQIGAFGIVYSEI